MRLTEEKLKEILQRPQRSTPRRTSCLTEEQFLRAAAGEMNTDERRDVARHLIECMNCTEDYRTLRSLQSWADDARAVLSPSPGPSALDRGSQWDHASTSRAGWLQGLRGSFSTFWQGLIWERRASAVAALATIVVVVGGSLVVWRSIGQQQPTTSTERAAVSLRLNVEPPNRAILGEPPGKLSWSALERTLAYRVVLYDFQSTPIWESARLKETSATLPESLRRQLGRGQAYYWRVIAEDAIDQRQSDLFQFSISLDEHR